MRNLSMHRIAYLRSLDAINLQLASAHSVANVMTFTDADRAWFKRSLGGK